MLRRNDQKPMPDYSKAPWGLFVLPRVGRIFTANSISPSPSLRQRSGRYAFRAGRNLPDKEFRYLRTVIVTAAVHWGFGSGLAPLPLTFQHRASVAPYTSAFAFAESCVFGKQSPEPIHCGFSWRRTRRHPKHPFSRSYGARLQSSLTRVLSRALVLLHPPTCVGLRYGHSQHMLRSFSWLPGFSRLSACAFPTTHRYRAADLPTAPFGLLAGLVHGSGPLSLERPSIAVESGTGILTSYPSGSPLGFPLGPA